MANAIVDTFHNCTVRVAFVGYRDYTEGDKRFQVLDFTNDTSAFVDYLGNVKAYAGGDVPEDVLGGLDQALSLDWQAKNKVLFHIGIINDSFHHSYIISNIKIYCNVCI